jgi:hypothetical protein
VAYSDGVNELGIGYRPHGAHVTVIAHHGSAGRNSPPVFILRKPARNQVLNI